MPRRKKEFRFFPTEPCANPKCNKMVSKIPDFPPGFCSSECEDEVKGVKGWRHKRGKKELQVITKEDVGSAEEVLGLKF